MNTILFINNEHCTSLEQLKKYFNNDVSIESELFAELVDYARYGDMTKWLKEHGNHNLADLIEDINEEQDDKLFFEKLSHIITGEFRKMEKLHYSRSFVVSKITNQHKGNILCVDINLVFDNDRYINDDYEICVEGDFGNKCAVVNPSTYKGITKTTISFIIPQTRLYEVKIDNSSLGVYWVDINGGKTFRLRSNTFTIFMNMMCVGKNKEGNTYYIAQYPVTNEVWSVVMKENCDKSARLLPKNGINALFLVTDFLNKLNSLLESQLPKGYMFCLPTDEEWVYAAKGGEKGKIHTIYSGSNIPEEVAVFYPHSKNKLPIVGTKMPNEINVYDMCGCLWELCSDGCFRGGCFADTKENCEIDSRNGWYSQHRATYCGFRVALKKVNVISNNSSKKRTEDNNDYTANELFKILGGIISGNNF